MPRTEIPVQYLLTLPPRMVAEFEGLAGGRRPEWFATSDPPSQPLGSGGGTANLLAEAWRATAPTDSFEDWLRQSRKLILHAGGLSRRLPAYAPTGKLLMPIPVFRWSRGQRLDQSLLDLQLPDYERVLAHAGPGTAALVTSGDVLLRFARELPPFPDVDVLGLGMWVAPEKAKHFGVFFSQRAHPTELAFFLQKPAAAKIRELAEDYLCLVDTGMWLLSERAVRVLMEHCGWETSQFCGGAARRYELYAEFGLALGKSPTVRDAAVNALTCAVVPLPEAEFYHFGTNAQMIESVSALQNLVLDESKIGRTGARQQPDQVTQNSRFDVTLRREGNHTLWVENSVVPSGWQLASQHVLTGVPDNDWTLQLHPGVCLDFVPIGEDQFCARAYGFSDSFAGPLDDASTRWLSRPALDWFVARGLKPEECGVDPQADIHSCPLFPVIAAAELAPAFVEWLFAPAPGPEAGFARRWRELPRLSAQQIPGQANLRRLHAQRARLRDACLVPMLKNFRWSVFFRLDLESTARAFAAAAANLPDLQFDEQDDPMQVVHDQMFRSAVLRHRQEPGWEKFEAGAFSRLREMIAHEARLSPARAATSWTIRSSGRAARSGSTWPAAGPIPPLTASSTAARCSTWPPTLMASRPSRSSPNSPTARNWLCVQLISASRSAFALMPSSTPLAGPTARSRWPRRRLRSPAFCRVSTRTAGLPRWSSNSVSLVPASKSPCSPPCRKARAWAPAAYWRRPSWPRWAICAD